MCPTARGMTLVGASGLTLDGSHFGRTTIVAGEKKIQCAKKGIGQIIRLLAVATIRGNRVFFEKTSSARLFDLAEWLPVWHRAQHYTICGNHSRDANLVLWLNNSMGFLQDVSPEPPQAHSNENVRKGILPCTLNPQIAQLLGIGPKF